MYKGIFDSHAHYNDEWFDEDRDDILKILTEEGFSGIVNCATDIPSCEFSRILAEKYGIVYFAAGIHPEDCENLPGNYLDIITDYLSHKKCVAIGEIGLDYHYDSIPKDLQHNVFEIQLQLAKDYNLPVIIHDREAHADTLDLVKKYKPKGVFHCFSGSTEMAEEIYKTGMYIGLGGAVTFKNARKPVEVAKSVPIDKLLLETDCPYMSPVPMRGKRNDSRNISFTAEFIADVRNIKPQELIDMTADNARKLFGIQE